MPARVKNSARERGSSRSVPSRVDVMVLAPTAYTPRRVMHRCSASMTTPTPLGTQVAGQPVGDLLGEPLLHLRPVGEQFHHAGELGQAEDALAGQIQILKG